MTAPTSATHGHGHPPALPPYLRTYPSAKGSILVSGKNLEEGTLCSGDHADREAIRVSHAMSVLCGNLRGVRKNRAANQTRADPPVRPTGAMMSSNSESLTPPRGRQGLRIVNVIGFPKHLPHVRY